ncbi:18468_t:CDS:2, partial [Racocetra fulgida]
MALENETQETLNEKTWAELIALCQDRIPAPSTPRLISVDGTNVRHEKMNTVFMSLLLDDEDISKEIRYDELEIGKKLGSGGFKDCYMGRYKGELVAIGELRVANFSDSDFKEIRHEINVL